MIYIFGDLRLDTARRELTRDEIPIKLPKLSYNLLDALVTSAPNFVSHEELIQQVWGEKRVISAENLSQRIALLRQSLSDDSQNPIYIETIYGQGFRLIPEVTRVDTEGQGDAHEPQTDTAIAAPQSRRWVPAAITTLLLVVGGLSYYLFQEDQAQYGRDPISTESDHRTSIAVLPFSNLSPNADYAFYAAGLHDEVLNHLSMIKNLAVISRTSTLRYTDTVKPIPDIARELGVENIIEGSVRYSNNRIRVTVQLVHGQRDEHLWSKTYDRELGEIFEIESDLASNVARELKIVLSETDLERTNRKPTSNMDAFAEYVAAKQTPTTIAGINKAIAHYQNALELDPDYAQAWVGLAAALGGQAEYGHVDLSESQTRRQQALDRALQLDPLSGEAWMELTWLQVERGIINDPVPHYLKSIELSPNSAQAHHLLGSHLTHNGRADEGLPYLEKAVLLNPNSIVTRAKLSRALFYLGRAEDALQNLYRGIQHSPEAPASYRDLSDFLMRLGRLGEAMYWINVGARLPSTTRYVRNYECQLLAALLYDEATKTCYENLVKDFPRESFDAFRILYMEPTPDELVDTLEQLGGNLHAANAANILISLVMAERWEDAMDGAIKVFPSYFANTPLNPSDVIELNTLFFAAQILRGVGNEERASYLFDLVISEGQARDRTFGGSFFRTADLSAAALSKDEKTAIEVLQDVYDDGWRQQVWLLRRKPFQQLATHPEWEHLVQKFEADVAEQRKWYEKHKDDLVNIEQYLN